MKIYDWPKYVSKWHGRAYLLKVVNKWFEGVKIKPLGVNLMRSSMFDEFI